MIDDTGYNCKVIEYNGSAEVRFYDRPIKKRKRSKSLHEDKEIIELLKWFGAKPVRDETKEQREARENLSLLNSVNRTKKSIYELALSNEFDYFVTLTFRDSKIDRTDFKKCMKTVRVWIQNQKRDYAPDLKFLIIPELHKDGVSWHCHGLLADIGEMQLVDSGKVAVGKKAYNRKGIYANFPTIYNLSGWSWGYSTCIKTYGDKVRTARYLTKYITKQSYALTKNAHQHRFYASRTLNKPRKTNYNVSVAHQKDFLDAFCQKNDLNVVYNKRTSKYVDTEYHILEKATD